MLDFDEYRLLENKLIKQDGAGHYVKLRWIEENDASVLMELNNNNEIANCVVGNPKKVNYEEQLLWMTKRAEEKNTVRMMIEYDGIAVGTIIINNVDFNNKVGNINIKILPKYHGKKIGANALDIACQYAFEELNLFCLTAHILSDNVASISLFAKKGFMKEGILRSRVIKNEYRMDLISMSYLKN
ncbi:GNAT family protein [Parabacteroides distasonis]|nr:GNAT family protein [Parabacteroides distasonis]MDB9104114.1 GNAT family protein [Parabacteroides distasonis]MDB9179415.1 GNAT family protein [Parabacteroides distasonis]